MSYCERREAAGSIVSRNCGMDGGARAGKRNALSAPGANGNLWEHYDSRALRGQLGGSGDGKQPKRMPGTENATTGSRAQLPATPSTPNLREPLVLACKAEEEAHAAKLYGMLQRMADE